MKLKQYLTISHLMVLVVTFLCIFIGIEINAVYNARTKTKDYLDARMEFTKYTDVLDNPALYNGEIRPEDILKGITQEKNVVVMLYDPTGLTIYSSIPNNEKKIAEDELYSKLNEVTYRYNIYTLKKIVLNQNAQVAGFYELSIERANIKRTIQQNVIISGGMLGVIMIVLFSFIMRIINNRYSKPLLAVTKSMNEYAKGNTDVYINYKAKDEIGELCKHFNDMKEEIEENKSVVEQEQKAKEYMIATISHDLKTPLTSIRAYSEMLKLAGITDEIKKNEYLEIILSKCDYMRDMLDDLLTYNLLSMNYQLVCVEVEGEEFCEMLYSGVEATCEQKHIQVETEIDTYGNYLVDVKYMTRVVDNIVSNAIRHTTDGKRIWLGAFSTGAKLPEWVDEKCKEAMEKYTEPGLFLLVKNEGNAISEKDRENLFKPFYQGDEARSKKEHKGVGLGLSISKMIMEKHKGAIEVIPISGVGNIMMCYLKSTSAKEEE